MSKLNLLFVLCFCIVACSENGCGNGMSGNIGQGVDIDQIIERRGGILPDACSIVPTKDIAKILGKSEQEILLSDSTPRFGDPTHSSCFFKWEDPGYPNAGILIQAVRNPDEELHPDYISKWIDAAKTLGEQSMSGETELFEDFEGIGDAGAYSTNAGKYYWRLGEKVYFLVAFNSSIGPEEQYEMARKIAYLVTRNYIRSGK